MAKGKFASPQLTLEILPEHREQAIKSSSGGCLVADAIKRQYPQFSAVSVDMATIRFTDRKRGERYTYLTPESAKLAILSFDQGWDYTPEGTITVRSAVKITPIRSSGPGQAKQRAAARAKKLATLEAKDANGEELTTIERRVLTQLRNPKPKAERPTSFGPSEIGENRETRRPVVRGGDQIPLSNNPNDLRGHNRHFGARLSAPGQVFQDAVAAAVADQLGRTSDETSEDEVVVAGA